MILFILQSIFSVIFLIISTLFLTDLTTPDRQGSQGIARLAACFLPKHLRTDLLDDWLNIIEELTNDVSVLEGFLKTFGFINAGINLGCLYIITKALNIIKSPRTSSVFRNIILWTAQIASFTYVIMSFKPVGLESDSLQIVDTLLLSVSSLILMITSSYEILLAIKKSRKRSKSS